MWIFLIWLLFSVGIGAWAGAWSRNALGWGILAMAISPILAAIFLLASGKISKTCPKCAEEVKEEALKCKHCGFEFPVSELAAPVEY